MDEKKIRFSELTPELKSGVLQHLADEFNVPMHGDMCHWGKKSDIEKKLRQQGIDDFDINSSNIRVRYQDYILKLEYTAVQGTKINLNASSEITITKDGKSIDAFEFFTGKVDEQLIKVYNALEDIKVEDKFKSSISISNETVR